ncbi:Proteasome subunit beta type-2-A [Linum perenne]
MECVFGLVGDDFTIVAADTSTVHSILVHKSNEDKIMLLDSHKLVAASGEPGDRFTLLLTSLGFFSSIHGENPEERCFVSVQEWNPSYYGCCSHTTKKQLFCVG